MLISTWIVLRVPGMSSPVGTRISLMSPKFASNLRSTLISTFSIVTGAYGFISSGTSTRRPRTAPITLAAPSFA